MTHCRRDHVYTGKKKVRKSTKKRDIYFELFDINNGTDKIEISQDSFPKKIEKKKKFPQINDLLKLHKVYTCNGSILQ